MNLKVLGLFGTLGTAAAGGGIYWVTTKGSQSQISNLLSSEKGLLLITKSNDAKWNEAWKNYKDSQKEGNSQNYKARDAWNIKNWSTQRNQENAPDEFKQECERRARLEVRGKDSQQYRDVKVWCTRPKKVGELLNFEGKRVLLSQTGDSQAWGESWKNYRERHQKKPVSGAITYEENDELGVSSWTTKRSETNVPTEYKTACQTKSEEYINVSQLTEDATFKKVEKWCTKPK